ncbi:unnamed protein product [Rhizophagus irregularis]|uniref:Ion transport domain-containing protein n=1 Tax=Rhizophagus irregularis TaxID=588596 RepID=A0A2N1MVX5_9GLOM|nr:hypothetical protein RhiirC2_715312 [Rhizophagus irregularis]CAB4378825.1 unnamed protein product [Rhizophagus irregularis]CAB5371383.1 unnamed protein product [Rhizophagus irregularis]
MTDSQDLIQEANIIPVINIESGTPITERPDHSISFDHLKTSFTHEKHFDDSKSDKSSLGLVSTSHKVFEKITGSLTALSKSLRDSFDLGETDELEIINDEFKYDIDIVATSPGNKFIATWSLENGILAVFPFDSHSGPSNSIFTVKTPFNKDNVSESKAKIYISVSEDGQYVAISRVTITKESHVDTPNMDATATLNNSQQPERIPESSFVVYSIKNSKQQNDSLLNSMEILGPLIFVRHHTLVCFTKNNMHLLSTKHWVLRKSIRIDALIHSSPKYSNLSNEYMIDVHNILIESLKYGYLLWPEEKDGISVWDINGILRQWFYVEAKNISSTRNLFAISTKGDLVARFYEEKKDKSGTLCLFHTPTALLISEIDVPKSTFLISFLQNTDQIILCSRKDQDVRVQLWDCWAGLLVYEEKWTYLNYKKPLVLIGDKFVQAVGNELNTYQLFPNNSPSVTMQALVRSSFGCKTGQDGFVIMSSIEKQQGANFCWGHILDNNKELLCKFKFEPWHNWINSEIFIHWLDPEGKRFIMAGKDSVQIYKTKPKGHNKFLRIELQYIWLSRIEEIKFVTLETRDENNLSLIHVQLTNNETVTLSLPGENEITYRTLIDACAVIHYLRLQYMDDVQSFSQLTIKEQLKKLVDTSIKHFPTAFNKISLGNNEYFCPMEDFILFGWDDLVRKIIETDRYIPLFHNEEQTESALLLLVELQKSELVELLVNYVVKHVKRRYDPVRNRSIPSNIDNITKRIVQQPGFAWTLGKTLLDLYKYYPDKGAYIMKESSYFTTSLEAPKRILQTKLGNPFGGEERSHHSELKSVSRKARLPRGTRYQDEDTKKKSFSNLLNFLPRHYDYASSIRHDTGALIYYPDSTNYSERKQNMYRESYGTRQKQRKQRLEDAKKTHPAKLCVVPWPDFCVYPPLLEDDHYPPLIGRLYRFWNIYISPIQRSPFADVALNGTSEMFSEVVMEAVIKFKWDKFAQKLFLCNFGLYLIHAILFNTIVSIESQIVPSPGDKLGWKGPLLYIETIIPMLFLIQELRQMSGRWQNYWSSFFNYFDLASFVLPLVCDLMVIVGKEPPHSLKSYAVLCVWINTLLQARAFAGPGKFIAIVIEIGKKIITLFVTLFVFILGFANALFVLLRDIQPLDIVQEYNGNIIDQNTGQITANVSLFQTPQENTNMWERFDYSILATYFFLGIGWDSVTTFNPDPALYAMMVLFSFVAVIILLNILIGLITEVFSGSLLVGRQAWLRQRAELIAELELFMLSPSQRQHPDWFPHLIYYEAHLDTINSWKRKLFMEEMGELDADFVRKELKIVKDELHDELKELKGMVGHIRLSVRNPFDGGNIGHDRSGRSSMVSV